LRNSPKSAPKINRKSQPHLRFCQILKGKRQSRILVRFNNKVVQYYENRGKSMRLTTIGISLALLTAVILPANAQKIADGNYWDNSGLQTITVKGGKFQLSAITGDRRGWEPISNLAQVKQGVVKNREHYWCLSAEPQPRTRKDRSRCSANGWNKG
jgi:hypothetical protein